MTICRILYRTDHHHSYNSRDLIGVYTNKIKFEKDTSKIIRQDISENHQVPKDETKDEIDWQIGFFLDKKQTQGLRNFELVYEEIEINKIF